MWQLSFATSLTDEEKKYVFNTCQEWHQPVLDLNQATPIWWVWGTDLMDRDPQQVYFELVCGNNYLQPQDPRLVVVGDALHSMSPFKGQHWRIGLCLPNDYWNHPSILQLEAGGGEHWIAVFQLFEHHNKQHRNYILLLFLLMGIAAAAVSSILFTSRTVDRMDQDGIRAHLGSSMDREMTNELNDDDKRSFIKVASTTSTQPVVSEPAWLTSERGIS
jgi:hypothetical protein